MPGQVPRQKSNSPAPSLGTKLTVQVAILSALGLSGITGWAIWQMQQILVGSHQQTLDYVAERFPAQLENAMAAHGGSQAVEVELTQAVERISSDRLMVWIANDQGQVLARSAKASADTLTLDELFPYVTMASRSRLLHLGDRYLLICGRRLMPQNAALGQLYLVLDVTEEQERLLTGARNLVLAAVLVFLGLIGAIAYSIRQATQPLQIISQTASAISARNLGETRLELAQAPAEIVGLVEAFNAMLERLAIAWGKQRQFVNDASHELRTPLAIVQGYVQSVLRRPSNLTPRQVESLETAAEEAERTIQLLQEMLDLARSENGELAIQMEPITLQPLLKEAAAAAEVHHQRTIVLELPSDPIVALSDAMHLRQVLRNLLENAIQYSEASVQIELSQQEYGAVIAVRDRGIGISPEQQAHIFERFYRADEARHRQGGTGLGLALVKALVEAMGGQITVQSQLNQGSTFTLTLPHP